MRALTSLAALLTAGIANIAAAQVPSPAPAPPLAVAPLTAPIRLKILAKGRGLPLGKAEVIVNGETFFTGPDGVATFVVPPVGDGKVVVTKKGYELAEIPFADLRPPGDFDAYLLPGITDENVVIIRGARKTAVSRKSISIQEAAKVAPGGDPAKVVQLLPGVQTGGFRSEPVVRGSGPRDSRYFIDNLEVPFLFHAVGNLSILPASLLTAVDFESGGFGPENGNATGGIITLRTKTDIPERPRTEFVVNVPFYSGVFHERALSEDSSLSVSLRRSYVEAIIKAILARQEKESMGSLTLTPYFGDAQVTYLKKRDDGYTKVSLLSAYDGLRAVFPLDGASNEDGRGTLDTYTGFANFGVERLAKLDKNWRYNATPQLYVENTKVNVFGNKANDTTTKIRVPTEFTRRLGKGEDLAIGFDPSWQRTESDYFTIPLRFEDPTWDPEDAEKVRVLRSSQAASVATWVNVDQVFGDATLSPGVRATYNGALKEANADPRLRGKLAVGDGNTLKAAIGRYSQAPQPRQSAPTFGNPALTFQHSQHYVGGYESNWGDEWTTEVQGYYKTATQVVTTDPVTFYSNDASFKSRGLELFLRKNLTGRAFGWISYTYSKTLERKNDRQAFHDGQYDQTHVLNAVGNYRLTGTYDVGGRYQYHTGDTTTTINEAVYKTNYDKYVSHVADAEANDARLPQYNALTLYLNHDFLWDSWQLAMRVGVESWWYKAQVQGSSYNYDFSKRQDFTGLGAIPFFEVKGVL